MKYLKSNSDIHIIARALLINDNNIILCQANNADWYFLPGGHVENGESAKLALQRELQEETGNTDFSIKECIGICENVFKTNNKIQHEINIIFHASANKKINCREKHISYTEVDISELNKYKVLPESLKPAIIDWLKNKKPFHSEL